MAIWKFCLEAPATVILPLDCLEDNYFPQIDNMVHKWFSISVAGKFLVVSVNKGYAWDGCTPKFKVCNKIVGVLDGPYNYKTKRPDAYYASLIHDVLLQFYDDHTFRREEIDRMFYWLLKRDRFAFAELYYSAVRTYTFLKTIVSPETI